MPRTIQIVISDEQYAAAKEHGDSITVEQVISDRLDGLVSSATGLRAQKLEAKKALLKPEDRTDIDALEAEKQSMIDSENAKISAAIDAKLLVEADAAIEAQGVATDDPTFTQKVTDFLKSINPFTTGV